jgi:hypothetical protein
MAARNTTTNIPAELNVEDVLADAKQKVSAAMDALSEELARREEELKPLRERMAELNTTLARLEGRSLGRRASADLSGEERERRRQKRAERRAARKGRRAFEARRFLPLDRQPAANGPLRRVVVARWRATRSRRFAAS